MADRNDLYGRGFSYPFTWSSTTGGATPAAAVDSVRASLMRLFDTAPGEDLMNAQYGCLLKTLVFEQDDDALRAMAETAVRDAVARWEPRIADVVALTIDRKDDVSPNTLTLTVYFRLIQSQIVSNLVYPFSA